MSPSTQTKKQSTDLLEDVLLHILCFCGITGALSLSQTCRKMHSLAFTKHVWLALMQDLDARIFLDLPPGQNLQSFSVSEFIDLAKRTVHGPKTWSQHSKSIIAHQSIIHPPCDIHETLHTSSEIEVKLLPGGRWILFKRRLTFECWNVAQDAPVWRYHSHREAEVLEFAAEVVDGGQAAVIVLCQRTVRTDAPSTKFVEIVCLDFLLGRSRLLCQYTIKSQFGGFRYSKICGDLAIVCMRREHVLLFNWRTRSYFLFNTSLRVTIPNDAYAIALVPGYVLMASPDVTRTKACLFVWNVDSFAAYWSPVDASEPGHEVMIENVSFLRFDVIHLSDVPMGLTEITLSVHESPLHEGIYLVWLYACNSWDSPLCNYSMSFPPTSSPHEPALCLRRLCNIPIGRRTLAEISYAGYTLLWSGPGQVLCCRGEVHKVEIGGPEEMCVTLSAYGGTCIFLAPRFIVVRCYK